MLDIPLLNFIRSFFIKTFDDIVADFNRVVKALDAFAVREEQKAEMYLKAHLDLQKLEAEARASAEKARTSMANIGKLIGLS